MQGRESDSGVVPLMPGNAGRGKATAIATVKRRNAAHALK
jgi:hypothetical protein